MHCLDEYHKFIVSEWTFTEEDNRTKMRMNASRYMCEKCLYVVDNDEVEKRNHKEEDLC